MSQARLLTLKVLKRFLFTIKYVFYSTGGPIFRLKGSILSMSFLDCNGALIPYSFESWKDDNKRESKYLKQFFLKINKFKFRNSRNSNKKYNNK